MRWMGLAPLALLTLYGAYLGLRQGRAVANLTEADVLAAYAHHYGSEVPGGRPADCVARPGSGRVWIVIECAPTPFDAALHRRYLVGRDGRAIARLEGI